MLKDLLAALLSRSAPADIAGVATDNKGESHELVLYKFDACPYCQKVLGFLKKNPIPMSFKDIRQTPKNRDLLIKHGGKGQVPCLFIDGKPMYESGAIVAYLKSHYL